MLIRLTKYLLLAAALTPLIFSDSILFPFIFGKIIFFRFLVEAALILFLLHLFYKGLGGFRVKKINLKNPLLIFLGLFFLSLIFSTVFASNVYRAFWGDIQRGEGLLGLVHFFIFLLLVLFIFSKKEWVDFFKISLFVGLVNIFYGFLQFFGVEKFPFALPAVDRPYAFVGNPAFFAAYLFFVIIAAFVVFSEEKDKFWRYFSGLVAGLSFLMIFFTGTRGAIVGLAAGIFYLLVYFLIYGRSVSLVKGSFSKLNLRVISAALLVFLVGFGAVLFLTRDVPLWQKVPGLNRLAQTAFFDINDPSTQNRIITWSVSWRSFIQKPIFGWGLDNYITAYSKNYDPEYALYGDTWLDRAHNKIFDLLVMQGIFGLLAYLGVLVSLIYLIFKHLRSLAPYLTAVLVGYFVQNLFVFDDLSVYIFFFAFIGFVLGGSYEVTHYLENKIKSFYRFVVFLPVPFLLFSLFKYHYVPYLQAASVVEAKGILPENIELIAEKINSAFYPFNYAQSSIRAYLVDYYYDNRPYIFENPNFSSVADLLVKVVDEVINREPEHDPRWYLRKNQVLNLRAKNSPAYYEKAVEAAEKALNIAPYRQEIYYHLAFSLAGKGEYERAIEVAKRAAELNPQVPRAHYYLALAYSAKGDKEKTLEELDRTMELSPNWRGLMSSDIRGIVIIYSTIGADKEMANIVLKISKGDINPEIGSVGLEPKYFYRALYYYLSNRSADEFSTIASEIAKRTPSLKDDMEVLIDLAKKEKWEILENLVEFR